MATKTAPTSQLRLDWAYGYRGNQCRNNLYYNSSGEAVYFVAGVGIVHNVAQKKQRFFRGQSDDILCLALHPNKTLAATGQIGKDPFISVWDTQTMETVSILQGGHDRGIATVAFSGDGEKVVSTGQDDYHCITVWDWQKGKAIASTRGHGDKIFDAQFNPWCPSQLVTCGVKHIKFWTLCGNSLSGKKGVFGKKGELQTILCMVFTSEDTVYTGTLSGDIYQWKGHTLHSVIKSAHQGAIHSIHSSVDGFASGGKDGRVCLWNKDFTPVTSVDLTTTPLGYKGLCLRSVCWEGDLILAGTKNGEVFQVSVDDRANPVALVQGHSEGELWALAPHPSQPAFATGSDDKTVRIWSIPDRAVLVHTSTAHAVRSVAFSPSGDHLAAGMQNGSFVVFSAQNLTTLFQKKDRKEVLHEMKYSPDGQYLAVGSNDNFVDIYEVNGGYKHVGTCKGSSSFITHLDWSEDSHYIMTNSGASERLYYKAPDGTRVTKKEELEGIKWSTWTGVLGTEVLGIWPKYSQVNDVNATDVSFGHDVIVTGDDFGLVKLFRYPTVKKGAKFRKYTGHSAHVTNVRFTHDKKYVISTGGADHGVFQWRFLPDGMEGEEEDGASLLTGGFMDTDSEASDSDLSDVGSLDSDLEKEQEKSYDRVVYREDLAKLKEQVTAKQKREDQAEESGKRVAKKRHGVKSSATQGRKGEAPTNSLTLEFVHGYRGYDCRANLYYTKSGEIVYHVAALGIVYNKASHTQKYYSAHDDDILCLALHPAQDLVATGQIGRDPSIHVWDVVSMETVSVLQGQHYRGVCAVDFSGDGKKLASVGLDDDHSIVVWDWKKGEKLAVTRGHKDKIFIIKWNPFDANQLITVGVKHIKFWSQAGGGFTSKRGTFGTVGKANTTMLCAAYGTSQDISYTGGADGKVYRWNKAKATSALEAHTGPVFIIQPVEKGYLTGGKDGIVRLWDEAFENSIKTYKIEQEAIVDGSRLFQDCPPIRALALSQNSVLAGTKNSEILEIQRSGEISTISQGHMEGELWGLAMHPSKHRIVTASDDGTIRLWDIERHKLVGILSVGRPARCAGFSPDGKYIAIGMKDGSFLVVSAENFDKVATFNHRKEEISDVKFSPDCKYLAVASHDNFVDIYKVSDQKRVGICKGASSYITHVDWDESGRLLQVNTGDREVLYYEAPRGKQQYISKDDATEIVWDTWTCVLGDSCKGIWPPYTDVTDVNASCVSRDGQVIATGDDFGYVKLFQYPSPGKHAKCKQYVGHSAHVTNVRFTYDDAKMVSIGGGDTSTMVWLHYGSATGPSNMEGDQDTDSEAEEEGGFDSDVEREKAVDYVSKTYANPIREATMAPKIDKAGPETKRKRAVSRNVTGVPKLATSEEQKEIKNLKLDFIFGYRGFDTRQNLFYTPSGNIIYHAAGAGIVFDCTSRQQTFYLEHNDDIVCLALNPSPKAPNIVATGQIGKNAPVHIWDIQTKQTLSILQGAHSVGVCSVDFSHNGKLIVTVGLDDKHSVTVWRWAEGTKMAQATGSVNRIFHVQFRPDSTNKFVTVGMKHVRFWSLAGSRLLSKKGVVNISPGSVHKMQTMLSVAFAPNDITYTGSISGDIYMWKGHLLTSVIEKAHTGPVFAMFSAIKDNRILSAGKERGGDSVVKSWDLALKESVDHKVTPCPKATIRSVCQGDNGKILVGTQSSEVVEIDSTTSDAQVIAHGHAEGELWGLAVHPTADNFVTASCDKTVCSWSLTGKALLHEYKVDHEAASTDISSDGNLVAVGLHNGEFLLLKYEDMSLVAQKRDRSKTIQAIRFSPNSALLAVGSDDACVDIYDITNDRGPTRISYCRGIPSYVTHIDWSVDGAFIQICSGYSERLVFEVKSGRLVENDDDITWATWTSILGNEVQGIWPRNADKADVNTANVSHSGTAVATGDDDGCVKLFDQFPLYEPYASHKKFFGHSAHVTNVKFTHDDRHLLSAGGDDSCVFVWNCQ